MLKIETPSVSNALPNASAGLTQTVTEGAICFTLNVGGPVVASPSTTTRTQALTETLASSVVTDTASDRDLQMADDNTVDTVSPQLPFRWERTAGEFMPH